MLRRINVSRTMKCAVCGGTIHKTRGGDTINQCYFDGVNYIHTIKRCLNLYRKERDGRD